LKNYIEKHIENAKTVQGRTKIPGRKIVSTHQTHRRPMSNQGKNYSAEKISFSAVRNREANEEGSERMSS
jgi:hypothetical protein